MLHYQNLPEAAVIKFNDAFSLMGTRLKEKFNYLRGICTFPSTWDQEQLEDAVDRYARAQNPCDQADSLAAGKYLLIS